MVIVPIPTASQLAMVFCEADANQQKGQARVYKNNFDRFQAKGEKNALLSPLLPATPSGKAAAGCGHPQSCRRGCGGLRSPQGSEPEGESPPQELTPQPGRRSHLTTPAQAGHRPKLPPPPSRRFYLPGSPAGAGETSRGEALHRDDYEIIIKTSSLPQSFGGGGKSEA